MAGSAEGAAFSAGIDAADLDEDAAFRRATFELMDVMARGALHLAINQQCFMDRFASQTGAAPRCRYRRGAIRQVGFRVADFIGRRIFQLSVRRREGRVVGERDRMHDVQVRPDLRAWINVFSCAAGEAAADTLVDGDCSIMATQTSQRYSTWRADRRV